MATFEVLEGQMTGSAADDFHALEERVYRAVELLRSEREARAAAERRIGELEGRAGDLQRQIDERNERIGHLEGELNHLHGERDAVRQRVERLLHHLDEFTGQ
jgi:chromosome segregation ATPase